MRMRYQGLDPVVDLVEDEMKNDLNLFQLCNGMSLKEKFSRELYLLLSIVFVLTRVSLYIFPRIASCIKALWVASVCHLTLGTFGGHVLHPIDVKRVWSKFILFNTRNFQKGARNARVWAPSFHNRPKFPYARVLPFEYLVRQSSTRSMSCRIRCIIKRRDKQPPYFGLIISLLLSFSPVA